MTAIRDEQPTANPRMVHRLGHALVLCCASLTAPAACGHESARFLPKHLGPSEAAVVEAETIAEETVTRIARERGSSNKAALSEALQDAIFAAWGRQHLGPFDVRNAERAAHARVLSEALFRGARAAGSVSDAELAELTQARWWELDRPPMLRTTHAVVILRSPSDDGRARKVAERILEAVRAASRPEDFRRLARAVATDGLEVRVEDLDPVTADGRAIDPNVPHASGATLAHYAEAYARAAFEIPSIGKTSGVVLTDFGYHVILAVEMIPERRIPPEDRRKLLESETTSRRAKRLLDDVLEKARTTTEIEIDRAALELTAKVRVSP